MFTFLSFYIFARLVARLINGFIRLRFDWVACFRAWLPLVFQLDSLYWQFIQKFDIEFRKSEALFCEVSPNWLDRYRV